MYRYIGIPVNESLLLFNGMAKLQIQRLRQNGHSYIMRALSIPSSTKKNPSTIFRIPTNTNALSTVHMDQI